MIKIQVTQEDIDKGERRSCTKCPLALAIAKAINYNNIAVGLKRWSNDGYDWHDLPEKAIVFRILFDEFGSNGLSPFEFELTYKGGKLW